VTTPQPGQPLPIQTQSWAHDAALLAIETAITGMIVNRLVGRLRELLGNSVRAWAVLYGSTGARPPSASEAQPIVELVHAVLDQVADETPETLRPIGDGVRAAYVLGLRQAGAPRLPPAEWERLTLREPPMLFMPYADTPKVITRQVVAVTRYADVPTAEQLIHKRERDRIVNAVRAELDQAKRLLDAKQLTEKGFTQVQVAIARAEKIEQRVGNAVAWHLLYANQQAVTDTAKRRGLDLIWISERDACVVCLKLNGDVVDPGDSFSVTATYGKPDDVPAPWPDAETLLHPPRHNRCRCRCEIHDSERSADLVDALKRESDRAIAYGWRTDSESGEVRRRAAEKLLAKGVNLPKSVKSRAARRVKAPGPFGGPVPDQP
jgi:hypothetical protein